MTIMDGDLYGRGAALDAVRRWLLDYRLTPPLTVLRGAPGAGKSALVTEVARFAGATGQGSVDVLFDARGATHADLLDALATHLNFVRDADEVARCLLDEFRSPWDEDDDESGYDEDDEDDEDDDGPQEDDDAVGSPIDVDPILRIVVDGLDEAFDDAERTEMLRTLTALGSGRLVRILVTTAPSASAATVDATDGRLIDLDCDELFDPAGLRDLVAALLTAAGGTGDTGRWNGTAPDRLVAAVVDRAGRNYLLAGLIARWLAARTGPGDPGDLPGTVAEALDLTLADLPDPDRARGLLSALAYGRGRGCTDGLWLRFAGALGHVAEPAELDALRARIGHLVRAVDGPDGACWRVAHRTIGDALLAGRDRTADERAIVAALFPGGPTGPTPYALRHGAEHAAAAGLLETLLADPEYLAAADLARLLPVLAAHADRRWAGLTAALRWVHAVTLRLPPARRATALTLAALHLGLPEVSRLVAGANPAGPVPLWAHPLTGHGDDRYPNVSFAPVGRLAGGEVLVCDDDQGNVFCYDNHGNPHGTPFTGSFGAFAAGRFAGRDVVVTGNQRLAGGPRPDLVSIRDTRGTLIGELYLGGPDAPPDPFSSRISAVTVGRLGATDVIAAADETQVYVWNEHLEQVAVHEGGADGLAICRPGGTGTNVLVAVGGGRVRLWDSANRRAGEPATLIDAPALGQVARVSVADGRWLVVRVSETGAVSVHDARDLPIAVPSPDQPHHVAGLAIGRLDDRDVLVVTELDGTAGLWRTDGRALGVDASTADRHRAGGQNMAITVDGRTMTVRADSGERWVLDLLQFPGGWTVHDGHLYVGTANTVSAWRIAASA